jgi:hypothetical protein
MAFDPQFGFFSIVMIPIVSITISMLAVIIYYLITNFYSFLSNSITKIYWYIYLKIVPNPFVAVQKYFEVNPMYVLSSLFFIIIVAFILWIVAYIVGFYESKEKVTYKHIIILLLTPIIYTPAQIFFWASAIILQFTKYKTRWR